MMRRTNIYLNPDHMKQLAALGKSRGLKPAHMTRIAIEEYLRRESRKK